MSFTGGNRWVEVEGESGTLREALAALFAIYPGMRDRILTEPGEIREHVNIFVGSDNVRTSGGQATALSEDAEIWIIPAISGGGKDRLAR
jgi:molybdopterin converting factor small subunit